MSNIYHNNLLAIQKTDTKLYETLVNIKTNETFEVYMQNDPKEANILDKRDKTILYGTNPLDEINSKYKELQPYKWYRFLYIFGIGNGYLLELLLKNPVLKKIYIFEPEIELIYIALNLIDFSSEILLGKLNIIHTKQISFSFLNTLLKADEKYHFKSYNLFTNAPFYEKYQNEILKTNQTIIEVFKYHVNAAGNDYKDELLGLENFLENIPVMLKNPSLKELISKSNIAQTAIIVATGPSLSKQLPLLKEIQDKVAIISVDASMPILKKWGIKPDIVTSIERVGATARFYKNISKEFQKDTVFAISAVADDDILYHIQDGIKQLSMRSAGSHYKFFGLDEWGYLGEGMSSANLAYELASMIGYKNIVFIGQDLAFGENLQSHSEGHIFGKNEIKNTSEEEYNIAYGGNGQVKTRKIWKMFLKGLEKQIYKNNIAGNIVTINATEGGSRIEGTKEIPFRAFCLDLPDIKKEKIILEKPDSEKYKRLLHHSFLKIEEAIKLGNSMQKQASKLLSKITKQAQVQNISQNMINNLIKEINKIRNKYYKSDFTSFYINLLTPLIIHVEYDIYKIMSMPENSPEEIHNKNIQIIQIHQEWLKRVIANVRNIIEILQTKQNRLKRYSEDDSKARYTFYDSLKDGNNIKIEPKEHPYTITFFADFSNYNSVNFINIIKLILIDLPDIKVKAICFDDTEILDTKRIFGSDFAKIKYIAPKDISEFLKITDIYIKDKSFINASLDNIENLLRKNNKKVITVGLNKNEFDILTMVENMNYKKDEFQEIKVYKNNKPIDTLKPKFTNNLADIKAKCFEYMIEKQEDFEFRYATQESLEYKLYMPNIDNEKFYEYSFMNSLETTPINVIPKENKISCIVSDKEINDEEYIDYFFSLKKEFPAVPIRIFTFTQATREKLESLFDKQLFEIEYLKTYLDFSAVVIMNVKNKTIPTISQFLIKNMPKIYFVLFNKTIYKYKVKDYTFDDSYRLLSFKEELGLTNEDIINSNHNKIALQYNKLLTNLTNKEFKIDLNYPMDKLKFYDDIEYALKYKEFRLYFAKIRSINQ